MGVFRAQRSRPTGSLPREILHILLWSLSEDRGRSEVLLEVCKPFSMYESPRKKIYFLNAISNKQFLGRGMFGFAKCVRVCVCVCVC